MLDGPTSWLRPVVRSRFPAGTALRKNAVLTPDDQNRLTVPLNDKAARVGHAQCDEMAAQLLFTLHNLTPAVDEVELRSGNRRLCSLTEDQADTVAARGSQKHAEYLYFLDSRHRLVRLATGSGGTKADPVPGSTGRRRREAAFGRRDAGRADRRGGRRRRPQPVRHLALLGQPARRAGAEEHRRDRRRPADRAELGHPRRSVGRRPQPRPVRGCTCWSRGTESPCR